MKIRHPETTDGKRISVYDFTLADNDNTDLTCAKRVGEIERGVDWR